MSKKTIILLGVIVLIFMGIWLLQKNNKDLTKHQVFKNQEECERSTELQCYLFQGLCQVMEPQNEDEAIENEIFLKECTRKIGTWQPIDTASSNDK